MSLELATSVATINTPNLPEEDKLEALKREFQTVLADSAQYVLRINDMDDARFCRWMGQSVEGRKWSKNTNRAVFPWEGASDSRNFLIDDTINDDVDIMMLALKRARMQAKATNWQDAGFAQATTTVLEYVLNNQLADEWLREVEFAANWRQHFGAAVTEIDWFFETGTEMRTITIQDLIQIAQQDPNFAGLLQYLVTNRDKLSEEDLKQAAQVLKQLLPDVPDPEQAVKDLLATGQHQYKAPYLKNSRPTIMALAPLRDVFFPLNTYDIQKGRWIVRRDVMNEAEMTELANIEGWDPKFLEQMKRKKGESVLINFINTHRALLRKNKDLFVDEFREMYEVFYAYSQEYEDKAKCIYTTVFHPSIEEVGVRQLSPYLHGKFPFALHRREKSTRSTIESRGVADVAEPAQQELKTQRDFQTDRTALSILPPIRKPNSRGKMNIKLGPAVEVTETRPGEISFMEIPPMDQETVEISNFIKADHDSYFGKFNPTGDPNKVVRKQQRLADSFLSEIREVVVQIGQLLQQYMDPGEWNQICGVQGQMFNAMSRDDIQKEFHLSFQFDARDLDTEFVKQKLEAAESLAQMDRSGTINFDGLIRWAAQSLDPGLASIALNAPQSVTQKEINDEQDAVVKISLGIEPPLMAAGANFQLRLQVIQFTLQQSPKLQQLILSDQQSQEILKNRVKNFQFQIAQQQNAQIGKLGTKPIQQGPQDQPNAQIPSQS